MGLYENFGFCNHSLGVFGFYPNYHYFESGSNAYAGIYLSVR